MIQHLVILGASGDLTARYLVPALAALQEHGDLPEGFTVLGMARSDWSAARFQGEMRAALEEHAPTVDATARAALVDSMTYLAGDVTKVSDLRALLSLALGPVALYLALPPHILAATVRAVIEVGVVPGSRIAIEKPFGQDLRSARELNELLRLAFPESSTFRVDHFLAEPAVQSLLGLRFGNRLLEPIWNRDYIEQVEVIWEETLALEGRASYYDTAGQLRDMVQSHLLQVLCFVAMEPPRSLGERDLRDRKVTLLRAVRQLTPDEVDTNTVRARYTRGTIEGRPVPAYVDEEGVDPSRHTETFAQVGLSVDNVRWAGVPFVLRTGKALGRRRCEILVHFRPVAHLAFDTETADGGLLRVGLDPATLTLGLPINPGAHASALETVDLAAALPQPDLPPYSHLLLDILQGENALSVRDDEVEACWSIVEPILEAWDAGRSPLREYAAGADAVPSTGGVQR